MTDTDAANTWKQETKPGRVVQVRNDVMAADDDGKSAEATRGVTE